MVCGKVHLKEKIVFKVIKIVICFTAVRSLISLQAATSFGQIHMVFIVFAFFPFISLHLIVYLSVHSIRLLISFCPYQFMFLYRSTTFCES